MKKWTLKALEYIHRNGLNNTEWNIETEETETFIYNQSYGTGHIMKPHIALYEQKDPSDDDVWLYNNCDYALNDPDGQVIFIYEL